MAYKTQAEFDKAISVFNAGITIHIRRDGAKFGRLQISKAGVKWLPSHKSKRGPDLSWSKLAEILTKNT